MERRAEMKSNTGKEEIAKEKEKNKCAGKQK